MKFLGATKPLMRTYQKLADDREAASMAIFAAAHPRMDVPWLTCFRDYADDAAREHYLAADKAVLDFELKMSASRRGYFDRGHFHWYTR